MGLTTENIYGNIYIIIDFRQTISLICKFFDSMLWHSKLKRWQKYIVAQFKDAAENKCKAKDTKEVKSSMLIVSETSRKSWSSTAAHTWRMLY